jgi:hypothetical protein
MGEGGSVREYRTIRLTADEIPRIGMILRHFKGPLYKVSSFAMYTDAECDDLTQLVLYRDLAEPWRIPHARPLREFSQEVKDDSGAWVRRFAIAKGEPSDG